MAKPAERAAGYQDVLNAPPHMVAEVVAGQLHLHPRPAVPHAAAATALGEELGSPFKRGRGGPGGWLFLFEPELHLGPDIVVPDLAGWRREHMPTIPDAPYLTVAPDWLAEVLSPGTEKFDRTEKLGLYAGAKVAWVWLVNPRERLIEILQLGSEGHWIVRGSHRDEAKVRIPPFDAIEFEVGTLWADVATSGA